MKATLSALLALMALAPASGYAAEQLIPAGTLIQCTVTDPTISSKAIAVGDPVLCQISHFTLYGRPVLPYGSYLMGEFKEYKDPGHFVGKGWMDLEFDRIATPSGELPIEAKVVATPKYPVDRKGRIDGKGHPVRDAVEWSIPILWPIDVLNLPRRGPRPVLKAESLLTLKMMDTVLIPDTTANPYQPSTAGAGAGPTLRRRPTSGGGVPAATQVSAPVRPLTILATYDGYTRLARRYWFQGGTRVVWVAQNGNAYSFPIEHLDLSKTIAMNQERGVNFVIRSRGD